MVCDAGKLIQIMIFTSDLYRLGWNKDHEGIHAKLIVFTKKILFVKCDRPA